MRIHISALAVLAGATVTASVPAPAHAQDGKAVFQKNCAACHQANGKGIPGAFPALAGNAVVQGPAKEPATDRIGEPGKYVSPSG